MCPRVKGRIAPLLCLRLLPAHGSCPCLGLQNLSLDCPLPHSILHTSQSHQQTLLCWTHFCVVCLWRKGKLGAISRNTWSCWKTRFAAHRCMHIGSYLSFWCRIIRDWGWYWFFILHCRSVHNLILQFIVPSYVQSSRLFIPILEGVGKFRHNLHWSRVPSGMCMQELHMKIKHP